MKLPFELHNGVVYKHTSVGCEPKDLVEYQAIIAPPREEKILVQRDEHSSYFFIPLYHDEFVATSKERIDMSEHPHPTIIIEKIHEPPRIAGGKTKAKIHEGQCKIPQGI